MSNSALFKLGLSVLIVSLGCFGAAPTFADDPTEKVMQGRKLQPKLTKKVPNPALSNLTKQLEKQEQCDRIRAGDLDWRFEMTPKFDWSMAPRYGNGSYGQAPLLLNSKAYVQNTQTCNLPGHFKVKLRTQGVNNLTKVKQLSPAQISEKLASLQCGADSNRAPSSPKTSTAPSLDISYTIKPGIKISENRYKSVRKKDATSEVCLPEGIHEVTLHLRRTGPSTDVQTLTRNIEVIDHLIVNIGDSYAAGEGAPERLHRWDDNDVPEGYYPPVDDTSVFASWAPAVPAPPSIVKKLNIYKPARGGLSAGTEISMTVPDFQKMKQDMATYGQHLENMASHRSSFTAASQLALQIENADDKSSVTFVNLAQSGATVRTGLTGLYHGVGGERGVSTFSCDLPGVTRNDGMCPQLDQLRAIIGDREIDHLYMSIGGNDAGFARIITDLLSADVPVNAEKTAALEAEILSGIWEEETNLPGLDGLSNEYAHLACHLQRDLAACQSSTQNGRREGVPQKRDLKIKNISLMLPHFLGAVHKTGFPNRATWSNERTVRPSVKNTLYCGADISFDLTNMGVDTGIPLFEAFIEESLDDRIIELHPREMKWADGFLFPQLTSAMKTAANRWGWNVLDPSQKGTFNQDRSGNSYHVPSAHGICGKPAYSPINYNPKHPLDASDIYVTGRRWYRAPFDGAVMQEGDTMTNKGHFHPNEFGYAYMRDLMIKDHNNIGIDFPGAPYSDTDDEPLEVLGKSSNLFTLKGSHDVASLLFDTDAPACKVVEVSLTSADKNKMAISVFKDNGQKLTDSVSAATKTTAPNVGLMGANSQTARRFTSLGGTEVTRTTSKLLGGQSCEAKAKTLGLPRLSETAQTTTLTFIPKETDRVLIITASFKDNLGFDPISGKGDNRSDPGRSARQAALKVKVLQ